MKGLSAACTRRSGTSGQNDQGPIMAYADGEGTSAVLVITGLDPSSAGKTYGAHVHSGPCVGGQPAAAGPHYNIEGPTGPPDPDHEVWLDFTVLPGGVAYSQTAVPFVIPSGAAQSVVIHEKATDPNTGAAGARLACLPVPF